MQKITPFLWYSNEAEAAAAFYASIFPDSRVTRVAAMPRLKDRFGRSWQIVPAVLGEMMADPDRARARRAADAMMKMVKLDIAALQAAHAGTPG